MSKEKPTISPAPVEHGWDSFRSVSGVGVCKCGWKTRHYAMANDSALDAEFDRHLTGVGAM